MGGRRLAGGFGRGLVGRGGGRTDLGPAGPEISLCKTVVSALGCQACVSCSEDKKEGDVRTLGEKDIRHFNIQTLLPRTRLQKSGHVI